MTLSGPLVLLSMIMQGKALELNWGWHEAQHRVGVRRVENFVSLWLHPSPRSCAAHRRKLTDNKAIN